MGGGKTGCPNPLLKKLDGERVMYTTPSVSDFKTRFARDFPYGSDLSTTVTDGDVSIALSDAGFNINEGLFSSQSVFTMAYLLLSAHFLVTNLRASSQGISGQYGFLQASKGVGPVSESFSIPQRILDNPQFSMLCKTHYGAKYLACVLPMLSGQILTVSGGTHA